MSYKPQSLAKIVLVSSLLIGLSSLYFGQQWARDARSTSANLSKAQKEAGKTKEALEAMQTALTGGGSAPVLQELVPALMLEVFNQRLAYGVALTAAAPLKQGSGQMAEVKSLAEPVSGTSLNSVAIKLAGTYKTYPELLGYLEKITEQPVALSRLKIQDQTFEVTLRAFGVLAKD